jgi:hypothetical protein
MQRVVSALIASGILGVAIGEATTRTLAASPAAPSYAGVEKSIGAIRASWARPGAAQDPNAPGWNALFDATLSDLREYTQAPNSGARLTPLNRLYQISQALATSGWPPAYQVREELRQWLRPRVRLAWAERRLDDTVRNLPTSADSSVLANRRRWVDFVENDLGHALSQYDGATTVVQRQEALNRIHQALRSLQTGNQQAPWQPSWDLQAAVNDLFNQPNLDVTADVNTVSPVFNQNLVTSGPIYRKGYWSQVTAGPKTGFGLLPSDDGIAFYNSQLLTSVTPITDFQRQIAQDPQGRRAAKLYEFSATTLDSSQLTVYTVLRPSGLAASPAQSHSVDAQICSAPEPGGGFGRMIANVIGMNQNKITQKVYDGAIGQFRQRIPQEAMDEAQERIAGEMAQRNADLSRVLIGNNMAAIQDFLITGLSLRSRPEAVYVAGLVQARTGDKQRGADMPQPARLAVPDPGLTADVHLSSALTSAVDGLFNRPAVQAVDNVMIRTHDVPPGTPPSQAVTVRLNVDFPTYLKVAEEAARANNPKVTALRIKRPPHPPEFAVDARGFLVVLLRDLEIDAPAPDPRSQAGSVLGVPAKVLRLKIPQLESAVSYQVDSPTPFSHLVKGKIEEFNPSTNSQVQAINDDESKAQTLNRFSGALVLTTLATKIRQQPINASLDDLKLPGFAIQSISPLDPSGWMRVSLVRTVPVAAPAAPAQVMAAPAPAAVVPTQTSVAPAPVPVAATPVVLTQ